MKRNRLSLLLPLLFTMLSSCSGEKPARVDIQIQGVPDSTMVVVSKLSVNRMEVLDTLYTKAGKVSCKIDIRKGAPEFVYFEADGAKPIPFILMSGDNVHAVSDVSSGFVDIQNSSESAKMLEVDRSISAFNNVFDSLSAELDAVAGNAIKERSLKLELGGLYVKRKQESIRYIYDNLGSLTVLPLLYQRTSSGLPLFSEVTDVFLIEKIYDSLKVVYPASLYLIALADEVSSRHNRLELMDKGSFADVVDFPEIILPDMNGKKQSLTALKGNVIALVFWTVGNEQQRQFNVSLKSLYEKYHSRGFEIYQVSMDTDKTAWAMQVKAQNIPWVSVCEPAYGASNAARLYNVQNLPTLYLISRDGTIVAKNVFDDNLEKEIKRNL